MSSEEAQSYNANYATLKRIAEELRHDDEEPDIDGLVPKVEQALAAYRACRERLDQVERLLNERLGDNRDAEPAPEDQSSPTGEE
ncbi:MAG: exodeoxyribonuclease VII small subunit [Candidatus Competibacterales bacterium]